MTSCAPTSRRGCAAGGRSNGHLTLSRPPEEPARLLLTEVRRPRYWDDAVARGQRPPATLVLDATGDAELYDRLFPGAQCTLLPSELPPVRAAAGVEVWRLDDVSPHTLTRSHLMVGLTAGGLYVGKEPNPGLVSLVGKLRQVLEDVRTDRPQLAPGVLAIISYKGLDTYLRDQLAPAWGGPDRVLTGAFHALRGSNRLQDASVTLVVGVPAGPLDDVVARASALYAANGGAAGDPDPVRFDTDWEEGQPWPRYRDPRAQRVADLTGRAEPSRPCTAPGPCARARAPASSSSRTGRRRPGSPPRGCTRRSKPATRVTGRGTTPSHRSAPDGAPGAPPSVPGDRSAPRGGGTAVRRPPSTRTVQGNGKRCRPLTPGRSSTAASGCGSRKSSAGLLSRSRPVSSSGGGGVGAVPSLQARVPARTRAVRGPGPPGAGPLGPRREGNGALPREE